MMTGREYMDAEANLLLNEAVPVSDIADAIMLADTFREHTGLSCAVWAEDSGYIVKRALLPQED
jgi:hypothetical protein